MRIKKRAQYIVRPRRVYSLNDSPAPQKSASNQGSTNILSAIFFAQGVLLWPETIQIPGYNRNEGLQLGYTHHHLIFSVSTGRMISACTKYITETYYLPHKPTQVAPVMYASVSGEILTPDWPLPPEGRTSS